MMWHDWHQLSKVMLCQRMGTEGWARFIYIYIYIYGLELFRGKYELMITLHCSTLHWIAVALNYIALHGITLHCIGLQ